MKTFFEALKEGFEPKTSLGTVIDQANLMEIIPDATLTGIDYWTFKFGENNEYELNFEPLLFKNQYYVALYKNQELMTEKVVVKPGFIRKEE